MSENEQQRNLLQFNQKISSFQSIQVTQDELSMKQKKIVQKITVHSDAYPNLTQQQQFHFQQQKQSKKKPLKPQIYSSVHEKLKQISFKVQNHNNPILIRQFRQSDRNELRKLQNQWFPIQYSDEFYDKLLKNLTYCLIAQTTINVNNIETDNTQNEQFGSNNIQENQLKQKIKQKQNSNKQQKIIIGAVVFQLTSSQYLSRSLIKNCLKLFTTVDDSLYIMTLGVIDQFRKKGIARLLIQNLLSISEKYQNIKMIFLHVVAYNQSAIKFYQKNKFTQMEYLRNYYHIGGKQYDGIAYGRLVNDGKLAGNWAKWFNKIFQ